MFQPSSRIHPSLRELVEQAESLNGFQVLSAQIFRVPFRCFQVEGEILEPRKVSILEEFLLRAAVELSPPIECSELADMLRVDPRFMSATFQELVKMNALRASPKQILAATKAGEAFYRQRQIPQPPKPISLEVLTTPPYRTLALCSKQRVQENIGADEEFLDLPIIFSEEAETDLPITKEAVIEAAERAGKPIHNPALGIEFAQITRVQLIEEGQSLWSLLVIRDLLGEEDELTLQFRNIDLPVMAKRKTAVALESSLQNALEENLSAGSVALSQLMGITSGEVDTLLQLQPPQMREELTDRESRVVSVERLVRQQIAKTRGTQSTLSDVLDDYNQAQGTAELIRDGEIRRVFMDTLRSARKRVLVVSPWINDQAVDQELIALFDKLASRRVITLLGWGIARQLQNEKTLPPNTLLSKLQSIHTPEGLPAVIVFWLGNQHSKDVIVDHDIHLCGSHNWLSYRGDYLPRGESAYRVTIPDQIMRAEKIVEGLFVDRATIQFEAETRADFDANSLMYLLSVWIGTGNLRIAYERAIEILVKSAGALHMPLTTLCRSASEHLIGAEPATRLELLKTIGATVLELEVNENDTASSTYSMSALRSDELTISIRQLMAKVVSNDKDNLHQLLKSYEQAWKLLRVIPNDQSPSELIASLPSIQAKTGKKSQNK